VHTDRMLSNQSCVNLMDFNILRQYTSTVRFLSMGTCGAKKCGKKKEKRGSGYEGSACFVERDLSEKFQSQTHRPLEN